MAELLSFFWKLKGDKELKKGDVSTMQAIQSEKEMDEFVHRDQHYMVAENMEINAVSLNKNSIRHC